MVVGLVPVKSISAPSLGKSGVIVCDAFLIELASTITVSWHNGTDAPEVPPDVVDHLAVSDQLPLLLTQYLVTEVVKIILLLPRALPEPPDIPERFQEAEPAPVISLKSTLEATIEPLQVMVLAVPKTLDLMNNLLVALSPVKVKVPVIVISEEIDN